MGCPTTPKRKPICDAGLTILLVAGALQLQDGEMRDIRIGISGWRYKPWRGIFYPRDLRQKDELFYASRIFRSIEINGTFYSLQRPDHFRAWYEQTPDDFVFSVKAPRYITHILRLKQADQALANFFASGPLLLKQKFGPMLWQLPPNFKFDAERLDAFFALLPRSTRAAAALARRHDAKVKGRAFMKADADRPLRHALEIRHESFRDPAFIRLLRRHKVALVVADTVEWPCLMDETADFVYCRLHGSQQLYVSGYTSKALDGWARRVRAWSAGKHASGTRVGKAGRTVPRDVFVYFDNDAKVRAPVDAQSLMAKLAP
jgi:uncharacterized protein YecE (DUF72 family)